MWVQVADHQPAFGRQGQELSTSCRRRHTGPGWQAGRGTRLGTYSSFQTQITCWQNTNTLREEKRVLGTSSRSPGCVLRQAHTVRGLSGSGSASRGITLYMD